MVTLTIDAGQSGSAKPGKRSLVDEVVDELTSWGPKDFIGAFQRWHAGALSLMHLNVLILLESTGPLPMNRLAEALDISVASVTGVVDRMEVRGLVARRRDDTDRRVILVEPAEGGRQLFAEIDARRRKALGKLLAKLSDKDLKGLLGGHKALRKARGEFAKRLAAEELEQTVSKAKAARLAKIERVLGHGRARAATGEPAQ
ncbi:MAG TPA: MarR family transcriptional regulator [Candidatus Limnocylindrales bacterium]|nr:MarR family transcriptional regulator [Candidatus Limnocylindrales bacterium]